MTRRTLEVEASRIQHLEVSAMNALLSDIRETQHLLEERLARARVARASLDPDQPRDKYPPIDTYLATASRHLSAAIEVFVPAARSRLPDGGPRAKEFLTQSRQTARALNQVKAKLYGSVYATGKPWSAVWDELEREYARLLPLEMALAEDLAAHGKESDPDWVLKLHQAEVRAPTRPHPHIPQQGVAGQVARGVARRVDAFWDAAEGRMVPAPAPHHERSKDGPMTQWLLADPHLEESAGHPDRMHRPPEEVGEPTGDRTEDRAPGQTEADSPG